PARWPCKSTRCATCRGPTPSCACGGSRPRASCSPSSPSPPASGSPAAGGAVPLVEVRVSHRYPPGFTAAADFTSESAVTALVGPSGRGKSSVLAMVAGLLRPDAGLIRIAGRTLFDSAAGVDLPPHERGVGFAFQDQRLFPHLRVGDNL